MRIFQNPRTVSFANAAVDDVELSRHHAMQSRLRRISAVYSAIQKPDHH
jgi:hypothetical protein